LRRHDGDVWRCAFPMRRVLALPPKCARPGVNQPPKRRSKLRLSPELAMHVLRRACSTPRMFRAGHLPRRRHRMLQPTDDRRGWVAKQPAPGAAATG
jgi:hypothetical protein